MTWDFFTSNMMRIFDIIGLAPGFLRKHLDVWKQDQKYIAAESTG